MPRPDNQFQPFVDDTLDDEHLPEDKRRLIQMFRALPEEKRVPLLRVAEYLAAHPSNGAMSQAEFDALCESAKRLQ